MPRFLGETPNASSSHKFDIKKFVTKSEYEKHYHVLSDYLDQSESELLATAGLPQRFSVYNGALCLDHKIEEIDRIARSPHTGVPCSLYLISATFTTDFTEDDVPSGGGGSTPEPVNMRAKLAWSCKFEEEVIEKDLDGKPITTTANEPIIITKPQVIQILTVKRYELAPFAPLKMFTYAGSINLTPFYGAPVGCALMADIKAEETTINSVLLVEATYTIEFKILIVEDPDDVTAEQPLGSMLKYTQYARPLNNGYYYYKEPVAPHERPYTQGIINLDVNGIPQRTNLSFGGNKLVEGEAPRYLEFRRNRYTDFNSLNLGPY